LNAVSDEARPGTTAGPSAATGDPDAMQRVQAGDEAALAALMERWELPVKRFIGRLIGNASEADELAQETFVRVWQERGRFRPGAEFRPWLFAIALNLARNRLRWWRRRPTVSLEQWNERRETTDGGRRAEDRGHSTSDNARLVAERAERAAAVREAVAALPLALREAIVLSEYEQMSHAEIATAVGATAKAVETRIYRAREKLRVALKRWM
jgi:RNA polymerase sigma-70 factor (ECF subfamily)